MISSCFCERAVSSPYMWGGREGGREGRKDGGMVKIIVYLLTSLSTLAPKNAFTYFFIVSYNFWIRQSSIFTEYKFLATYSKFVYDDYT